MDTKDVYPMRHGVPQVGAYVIKHPSTGLAYVGSTNNLYQRRHNHLKSLRKNQHYNKALQRAYNDEAEIEFLAYFTKTREEAYEKELELMAYWREKGLLCNIATDVKKAALGLEKSKETREKLGQAHRGKKHTPEHIAKARRNRSYPTWTAEQREKMRKLKTGVKKTPEQIENWRKAMKALNYQVSDETRAKQSKARKGKKHSPEAVAKRSKAVVYEGVRYSSISAAARAHGVAVSTIRYRLNKKKE